MKKGFTLVELLAVIVILAIILAIAVPTISGLFENSRKTAFEESVNLIIRSIDTKIVVEDYDVSSLSTSTMEEDLGVSNINYQSIGASISDGKVYIIVVGKNKWEGLQAQGTLRNLTISTLVDTPEECFEFDDESRTIISYDEENSSCPSDVVIPSTINGVPVEVIGDSAFSLTEITSVVIPSGVLTIEYFAFNNSKLGSVTIPNTVTTIGEAAFANNNITSINIPNSVTSIGIGAFNNNQLSNTQAFIYERNGDGTIDNTKLISYGGKQREDVIIPENVTTIEAGAFTNNDITSVTLPSNLVSIGVAAFAYNNLTSIIIPSSVMTIAEQAFLKKEVTPPFSIPSISSNLNLISIINQTGRSFNWGNIINGSSGYTFETGTVDNSYGNVVVSAN